MPAVSSSLIILGCSQRKIQTNGLIPAIDRYDGPVFRVLRKHKKEEPDASTRTCILSAHFGLIADTFPIEQYDLPITRVDHRLLQRQVNVQLKTALDAIEPERLFVSVGRSYWPILAETLTRHVAPEKLFVATGGIGGRASQLAHWLRLEKNGVKSTEPARGEATLLGTTVRLRASDVVQLAREALLSRTRAARNYETWYVAIGAERVAPKWLVSVIFDKPVARFRTADARRILSRLGVDCIYANRH